VSVSGFCGTTQAAFIVTVAAMSGPVIAMGAGAAGFSGWRAHAAAASATTMTVRLKADPIAGMWRVISGLTYHTPSC